MRIMEDSPGLMYYNACWYDPYLNRWIQPDSIIPDPSNPLDFDRYSYVRNNPVNYTDPTGHITQKEAKKAKRILVRLENWGVGIMVDWGIKGSSWEEGLWTLDELNTVLQGVLDLGQAMGGQDAFKNNLGGVTIEQKEMRHAGTGDAHHVTLNANGFDTWTVVHELAHAWDAANGWLLSKQMASDLGAGFDHPFLHWLNPDNPAYWYNPGQGPPPAGIDRNFNAREDFAEAVTAYVYPGEAALRAASRGWPYSDAKRGYNYSSYLDTPRGQYIKALMVSSP